MQVQSGYNPLMVGLPKAKYLTDFVAAGVQELIRHISPVSESARRDNNLIYFLPVPTSPAELPGDYQGMSL